MEKSIIDDSTMFAVRCNDNQIVSYSDAELIGFKTIDDMAGQITGPPSAAGVMGWVMGPYCGGWVGGASAEGGEWRRL